jgi:hypothetical protein
MVTPPERHDPPRDDRLASFRALATAYSKEHSDELIDCTHPERFAVVSQQLFDGSSHRVLIYSDFLCRKSSRDDRVDIPPGLPIWDQHDVIVAATRFLSKSDAKLEIIVRYRLNVPEHKGIEGHRFLREIISASQRRGSILLYICRDYEVDEYELNHRSFMVSDEAGYRLELKSPQKSMARFRVQTTALDLIASFDAMKEDLEQALTEGSKLLKLY